MPSGCSRLKWMLPSPRWPNGTTRMPGISARHAAEARAISSGTFETGTETSFLTLAPFALLRLGMLLAQPPHRRALGDARGDRRVGHHAVLQRRLQHLLQRRAQPGARPRRGELHQRVMRAPAPPAAARPRDMPQHQARRPSPDMYSNACTEAGSCAWNRLNRSERRRAATAPRTSATSTSRGRGTSFSTAAVMMPERALGADEQLAQAIAGVVLAQPPQAVPDLPSGSTTSSPSTRSRALP